MKLVFQGDPDGIYQIMTPAEMGDKLVKLEGKMGEMDRKLDVLIDYMRK